jgi:ribosome-interacting GTPase 1
MPANLPPEYYEAEKTFKEARSPQEKIAALESLIATVPKHKGTDKIRADMRRRLSKLREEGAKRKKGGKGDLYTIQREGASQVALAGFPNSGKSSLLKCLTNANPVIADYPISTVMPLPGMMPFEDILIQLIDLPPIGNEATDGWVSGIIRNADVSIFVIDLTEAPNAQAEFLLEQMGKWKITNRGILIAANKADAPESKKAAEILKGLYHDVLPVIAVSSKTKEGLEELKHEVFKASGIIRVYSKEPGKPPDLNTPFTVRSGATVYGLAEIIHKDFLLNLKYACVWGSVKFQGQRVQRDYVLKDKDIVEFHI